jgi:hypothetical protein
MFATHRDPIELALWIVIVWAIVNAVFFLVQIFLSWRLLIKILNKVKFYLVYFAYFIVYSFMAILAAIGAAVVKQGRSDLLFVGVFLLLYSALCFICYSIQKPKLLVDRILFFSLPMSAAFNSSIIWSRIKYSDESGGKLHS